MLLFVGYALLSVTLMLHNAIEKEGKYSILDLLQEANLLKLNFIEMRSMLAHQCYYFV